MSKAKLKEGMEIWLNCEVSAGPLSEHLVRLQIGNTKWFGFVTESELSKTRKQIRAVILGFKDGTVTIGIRGHSPTSNNAIKASREQISGLSAVA
jgi:hypothetical protein